MKGSEQCQAKASLVAPNTYPPGPRSRIPFHSIFRMQQDPLNFLCGLQHDYGDISCFFVGPRALYVICDPEVIKDILVTQQRIFTKGRGLQRAKRILGQGLLTSEGSTHLRQRRLMQPVFHTERITTYTARMAQESSLVRDRFTPGEDIEMVGAMGSLTLDIVAKTLLGSNVQDDIPDMMVDHATIDPA